MKLANNPQICATAAREIIYVTYTTVARQRLRKQPASPYVNSAL